MNKNDVIYAGLAGESYLAAMASVSIDKGREGSFIVEADGDRKGGVSKRRKVRR